MNQQEVRRILCTIEKSFNAEREDHIGRLNAHFEITQNDDVIPINNASDFCETNQVFVTFGYGEIKNKYGSLLFEAECVLSSRAENKEGDCKYVTRYESTSEVRGLMACQVYQSEEIKDKREVFVPTRPITKTIFLYDDSDCFYYGPYEYDCNDDDSEETLLKLKSVTTPLSQSLPVYHIGKYSKQKIEPYLKDFSYPEILGGIKKFIDKFDEKIDFISDEQIISLYGGKVAQSSTVRNFSKQTLLQIRSFFSNSKEYRAFPARFERLFKNLELSYYWGAERSELIESFFKESEPAKKILENYIEENKDDYFKKEKESYKKKIDEELNDEKKLLEQIKNEKEKLESENRRLARQQTDLETGDGVSDELFRRQGEVVSEEISQKKKELDLIKKEFNSLSERYKKFKSIDELNVEIKDLERFREREKERTKDLEDQLGEIQNKLKAGNDELTKKLVELKPNVDALCGITPKSPSKKVDYNITIKNDHEKDDDSLREYLIDSVLDSLNTQGRKVDYYTAANLLTTIAQSQFTLFSGLPGTGKTSLAKILGNSLGLGSRFLNIPVSKGWSSSRDVLGFYNPLSQSYVASPTGLYDLIKNLDSEIKTGKTENSAPSIVLLDEFNLSQPEHYFSPFLEMSDIESKREINTGDPDSTLLIVPEYLKFIGTINEDESVQALTPRMLDRAAIINFDDFEHDYNLDVSVDSSYTEAECIVSGERFIELFKPKSLDLKDQIKTLLSSIVNILREDNSNHGVPIIVSYRKVKAIRSYYNVAAPLMYENSYAAFDYAVCQHIIPLLNGYGEGFYKRLNSLDLVLPEEMERSKRMLSRIIASGKSNLFSFGNNL